MERSGLRLEYFCLKIVKNRRAKKSFFLLILPYKTWWKPRLDDFFPFFQKIVFLGILGPPGNHAS